MTWESIKQKDFGGYVFRAKIFGGWLVRIDTDVMSPVNIGYDHPAYQMGYEWRSALTFVPDPEHKWELSPEEKG